MPVYDITLEANVRCFGYVTVSADSYEQAQQIAEAYRAEQCMRSHKSRYLEFDPAWETLGTNELGGCKVHSIEVREEE